MEESLLSLSYKIREVSKRLIATSEYEPYFSTIESYIVDSLTYGENGIKSSSGQVRTEVKRSWGRIELAILQEVRLASVYKAVLSQIQKAFTDKETTLDLFVQQLTFHVVQNNSLSNRQIQQYVRRYTNDLHSRLLSYEGQVRLVGMTIESEASIKLSSGISLRRPTMKDLSTERMIGGPPLVHTDPTAILEFMVEDKPNSGVVAGREAQLLVTMLRLFCTGSIQQIAFSASPRSLVYQSVGTVQMGDINSSGYYFLRRYEEKRLRKFMRIMRKELPDSILNETLEDEIGIAYDRYKQALREKNPIELRISNIVMGLEALYSDRNSEVLFRMKNRIAKIAVYVSYEPIRVRELISLAYDIRSSYAHGGKADQKKLAKFQELSRAIGSEHALMNLLRMSLVLFCGLPSKNTVIQLCDNALIDKDEEAKLNLLLSKSKTFAAVRT